MPLTRSCYETREVSDQSGEEIRNMSAYKGKKKRIGSRRRVAHQNDTAEPEELPGTDRTSVAQLHIPERGPDSASLLFNPDHSQADTQHPSSSEILEDNGGKGSSRQRTELVENFVTEQGHKPTEEVEENMGNETLGETRMPPAMQDETPIKLSPTNEHDTASVTQIYSASVPEVELEKDVQDETRCDTTQSAVDGEEAKEVKNLSGTFPSSGLGSHPAVNEQVTDETTVPQKQLSHAANAEIGQLVDGKNLSWQDGVSQTNNLATEPHVDLRDVEPLTTSAITTEKNNLGEHTKVENVKQVVCFSPTVEQVEHSDFPEHLGEVALHENKIAVMNVHRMSDSFEQAELDVNEDLGCSANPMIPDKICDGEKSDLSVEDADLGVTREQNVANTDESKMSSMEISDTALHQLHKAEDQGMDYAQLSFQGFIGGVEEGKSSSQTAQFKVDAEGNPLSTEEQSDTSLNPMKSRRKFGSSRRHKGRHNEEAAGHESPEDIAGNISDETPFENKATSFTPETGVQEDEELRDKLKGNVSVAIDESSSNLLSVSPKNKEEKQPENLQFVEEITFSSPHKEEQDELNFLEVRALASPHHEPGHSDIYDTNASELSVKSVLKVLSSDDKQEEHNTKESMAALGLRSENPPGTEETQISRTKAPDTASLQAHEGEDQDVVHVNSGAEGFNSGVEETESSLPSIAYGINAFLESQGEDNPLKTEEETDEGFIPVRSRRKMGSSRRHKGSHRAKESVTEPSYESPEDAAGNMGDDEPSAATKSLLVIETAVQEESLAPALKETDKVDMPQTDQVPKPLPVSPGHHTTTDQSGSGEMLTEKDRTVCIVTDDMEREEDQDLFMECGHTQFLEEIVPSKEDDEHGEKFSLSEEEELEIAVDADSDLQDQEIKEPQIHKSEYTESIMHDATESLYPSSANSQITDTSESELRMKSIADSAPQHNVVNPDDKQQVHRMKDNNVELLEQKDEIASNAEDSQISGAEISDTASFQVHSGEDKNMVDVKPSVERLIGSSEMTESSLQTTEIDALLKSHEDNPLSTEEETENSFNPMKSRRKMGSSRRHKGRGHAKEYGADSFYESSEVAAENVSDKDPSETTEMLFTLETTMQGEPTETGLKEMDTLVTSHTKGVLDQVKENIPVGIPEITCSNLLSISPENKDKKDICQQPENLQFVEEITFSSQKEEERNEPFSFLEVKDLDSGDTNASELIVESTGDTATQREVLNPNDNQDKHPTKEIKMEVSDQMDEKASNTKDLQISNTERPDTALFQVYEGEDHNVKLGAEGFISGIEEAQSSLQTVAPEINAALESLSENNPLSTEEDTEKNFDPMRSRRKMGSSRRHKGNHHVKESVAKPSCESPEDVAENISDEDPTETTLKSFTVQTGVQGESTEPVLTEMDTLVTSQTEGIPDQMKQNMPAGTPEITSSNLLSVSEEKKNENDFSQQPENWQFIEEITLSSQKGEEQSGSFNLLEVKDLDSGGTNASELIVESVGNTATQREVLNPDDNQDEHPTKEIKMEVSDQTDENASNTEELQTSNTERPDTELLQVHEGEDHNVNLGAEGFISGVEEVESSSQTLAPEINAPLESLSENNPLSTEEENTFNPIKSRRKMGSSRRHKESHHAKESVAKPSHDSSEDVADNVSDKDPSETTEESFTVEAGVQGESTVLKVMDTLVTSQTEGVLDQVKENMPVDIPEITSSSLLSISSGNKDEKDVFKQPENWQFVEEITFSSQKGEEQSEPFNFLQVKDLNIGDTNATELIVESIGDTATQREVLNPDDNQEEHPTKETKMKVSDVTDKNASNIEESQISNTERPDTASPKVHEGEDHDVKLTVEGFICGVEEVELSSQTTEPEINPPLESQSENNPLSTEEETENIFNPMKSRRKMGSSRRHKGRRHTKEHHESSEDIAENINDKDPSETTKMSFALETAMQGEPTDLLSISPENKDEKDISQQPENWQFVEEIKFSSQKEEEQNEPFSFLEVKDLDSGDTNASELIVESIGDTATEHPTKEIKMEVSDRTDENASNTEELHISDTERPNTALFQIYEGEDHYVNLSAEGVISGVEEVESSLQTVAPEINAPLESLSENNPLSTEEETENTFNPIKSRRKMGSSQRHKGRTHTEECGADAFHESSEDVAENINDKDPSETTETSFTLETPMQEESVDTVTEDMDKLDTTQTEGGSDDIKESTPAGTSEFTSSEGEPWILIQSDSREMANEELLNIHVMPDKERNEDEDLSRHTQDSYKYLVSQSLVKAEGVVLASTLETAGIEYTVEKENMSSPNGKQSAKEEDDGHFNLSEVKDAQPSEGVLNNVYQQEIKPMEMHGAPPTGSSSFEESAPAGLQSPLDSQSQGNPAVHKLKGNKRKLGSSRRNKGSHVVTESPTSDEARETGSFDDMPTETIETGASSVTEVGKIISIENDKDKNQEPMQGEDTTLLLNTGDHTLTPGNDDSLKPKEEEIKIEPDILSHLMGHDAVKLERAEDSTWKSPSWTGTLDLEHNKEATDKEVYKGTEEESKKEDITEFGDTGDKGSPNLLMSNQKDTGEKHEHSPDERETLVLLDVGNRENKPIMDTSVGDESPEAESPHRINPTHKKRKMGSTRRSQLNTKLEEGADNDGRKEMVFNADTQHFGTLGEVEEAPLIVSTEVLLNQKAEPSLTMVHEVSTDRDLQRKPSGSAPDLISSTENVISLLSEKPSSLVEEVVNPFFKAPDTLEQQARQEDKNVTQGQDNLEVAAQETKYMSEEGDNTEMKSESPNLTHKRRKMGSTRKSLRAVGAEEDLHQRQRVNNEATDADVLSESVTGIEEEGEPKANDEPKDGKTTGERDEQRAGEGPALGLLLEIEQHLALTGVPSQPEVSPSPETMSELTPGRRRRKMGSHRKSHGHDNPTEVDPGSALKTIADESLLETTQQQRGPDDKSQVEESGKKSLLDASPSERGELSTLVTRNKTPQRLAAPQNPTINLGQGGHSSISLADSSAEDSYNVVMVGDSGVGKTSFMKRAQSGKFSLDIPSSIGLDTCLWTVVVDGKPVVLQLWDTAGQERFHSITRQVFHRAQAFVLMYDISSSQTFSAIRYWADCIQEGAVENVPILLVGNKSDHAKRQVTPEEGETLAKEYNFEFMECSAATGDNVVQSLETVARLLTLRDNRREEPLVLLKDTQQKKASGCC